MSNIDDNGIRRGNTKDSKLTTVVIVNKIVTKESEVDIASEEAKEARPESENYRALAESRVHNTPSRYKMGIMLAAIQANEQASDKEVDENGKWVTFVSK